MYSTGGVDCLLAAFALIFRVPGLQILCVHMCSTKREVYGRYVRTVVNIFEAMD